MEKKEQIYIHVDEICTHKPNCSYVNRCTSNLMKNLVLHLYIIHVTCAY